jgi:hypothetical protein
MALVLETEHNSYSFRLHHTTFTAVLMFGASAFQHAYFQMLPRTYAPVIMYRFIDVN